MASCRAFILSAQRRLIKNRLCNSERTVRYLRFSSASSSNLPGFSLDHPECNVTETIASKVGKQLHRDPDHPLGILKASIVDYFRPSSFTLYDDLSPVVTTQQNFDSLRIPEDHVSRSYSDTYYLNKTTLLRPHTSAHQVELLKEKQNTRFLVAGDVYRRDEIDSSHYPVFHQMEGVKIFDPSDGKKAVEEDLKGTLEGLATHLFGQVEKRWVDAYFPFTEPSLELEIYFRGEWMEVLGCGVIHPDILTNSGRSNDIGWAFGLGLERLAMILFQIPDIRLFWSEDERFRRQFKAGKVSTFVPYSKYPPCYKDMTFWLSPDYHVNDLNELVRDIAGDLVETVELIDEFEHPKKKRTSHCYRIAYRSMDRSLTNDEIDSIQEKIRESVVDRLQVELR